MRRGTYSPNSAIVRAVAYFSACWLIAGLSGVTATLFGEEIATSSQLRSLGWWVFTLGCLAVIVVAYGVIWPKGTVTHGRPRHVPMVVVFGFAWGVSQGQLYLAIRAGAAEIHDNRVVVGVVTFVAISAFTGVWHDRYWDKFVSPPHNIESWNGRKVAFCHVPNLVFTLTYLAVYDNDAIFVALQTTALVLSTWFMHFPPPSSLHEANEASVR